MEIIDFIIYRKSFFRSEAKIATSDGTLSVYYAHVFNIRKTDFYLTHPYLYDLCDLSSFILALPSATVRSQRFLDYFNPIKTQLHVFFAHSKTRSCVIHYHKRFAPNNRNEGTRTVSESITVSVFENRYSKIHSSLYKNIF